MLPRLEAEEKLAAVNLAALSNGIGFENDLDRQRVLASLEQRAGGQGRQAAQKADPADLAAMGIGMKSDGGELPTITDRDAWLGIEGNPSSSTPDAIRGVGEQDHG
jgi:hypothetical protein